jgi:Glycosyl hydrolases family 39
VGSRWLRIEAWFAVSLGLAMCGCLQRSSELKPVNTLEAPAKSISRDYFGMHFHRADRGTVWPTGHFGSWRLWDADVLWRDLQPAVGEWNWRRLDTYIKLAERAGVDVIIPLAMPPRWASARPDDKGSYGPGSSAEPKDFNAWTAYVRAVAERYKGRVRWYEIWNEVNEPDFFTGTLDKMIELTSEAQRVLKEVDSENRLLSPSTVGHYRWFERFLQSGGARFVDVVTYHFYVPSEGPEAMLPTVHKVRELMRRHGVADKPLWNTETGWLIANADGSPFTQDYKKWIILDQSQAAAYVARALILSWAAGVERFYWYSWDHFDMGFVEPKARTVKRAGQAYLKTVEWLEGGRLGRCAKVNLIWTCDMIDAQGKRAYFVWSESTDTPISFAIPPDWQVKSMHHLDGSSQRLEGERSIDVGPMPLMLRSAS